MKYAITDLGSNTIRLCVFNTLENGNFKTLFTKKVMAGLAGYVENGIMTPDGINQACAVLLDFQFLLKQLGIDTMYPFATASLRNIKNTEETIEIIRRRTGLSIDVIDGQEEGRLGYYGALHATEFNQGILFDIGGGSTEIVEIKKGNVKKAQSLGIGSLNLYTKTVSKFWPNKKELKSIQNIVSDTFKNIDFPKGKTEQVCCIGGTVRAVLKIVNYHFKKKKENTIITLDEFDTIEKMLVEKDDTVKNYVLKLCPDRIHTIIPGILIMNEIIKKTHCTQIQVSKYGVREGYLCKNFLY